MTKVAESFKDGAGWSSGISMDLILPQERRQSLVQPVRPPGRAYWVLYELVQSTPLPFVGRKTPKPLEEALSGRIAEVEVVGEEGTERRWCF